MKKDNGNFENFMYLLISGIIPSVLLFVATYAWDLNEMDPLQFTICCSPFLLNLVPYLFGRDWGDDDDKTDLE